MKEKHFNFDFVEKKVRSKTFGILTTLNTDNSPHSTGILYSVSPSEQEFVLYFITSLNYKKVRNIVRNPNVSLLIPFPHYWIRYAPSGTITITGKIDLVPITHEEVINTFRNKRVHKLVLKQALEAKDDYTFLKLCPDKKILCHGVGYNIMSMRKGHSKGGYSVVIPENKRCLIR